MSSYLTSDSLYPLAVHGASGSGKTSIMAKGVANAVSWVMYKFSLSFSIEEFAIVVVCKNKSFWGRF